MRVLVRVAVVLVLLLALGFGALLLFLPRLVESDAVRARIETAARESIGREVRYQELSFGLLPPSLVVVAPVVAGASPDAAPFAEARQVSLRVALLPLLARSVVVDSLVVEGAHLRLERTARGLSLPALGGGRAASETPDEEPAGGSRVALALRGFELRDATIELDDRAVAPPVRWELRDVDARVRGHALDEPLDVDASVALASGGRVKVKGKAALSGDVDLEIDLDALALAPLQPYVAQASQLAGALSGRIGARGPARAPSDVTADLTLREGGLRIGEIDVRGKMAVDASLSGRDPGRGRFEIDATDAEVSYADGVVRRPVGEPKRVTGNLLLKSDGTVELSEYHLVSGALDATGSATLGRRVRALVNVAPVELRELRGLHPALAEYDVSGPFRLQSFSVATSPLELRGDIPLDGIRAQLRDSGAVVLRGGLVAEGDAVRTRELELVAADQVVKVDGTLSDLSGTPRYALRTETQKAEANRLLSTFTSTRDRLFGPLDFLGNLKGSLGGPRSPLESLVGEMRFDIVPGRLVGVSILRETFRHFEPSGLLGALPIAGLARGFSVNLERFYGEDFESLGGTLRFADGVARTDDFRLVYRQYSVELAGVLGLVDLALDMRGRLTLGSEIAATLSGSLAKAIGITPRDAGTLVVPLPSVRGTLTDPKIRPDFAQMTAALVGNVPLVGAPLEGATGELLKGLGGLLGGRKKQP